MTSFPDRELTETERRCRDQLTEHINLGLKLIVASRNHRSPGEQLDMVDAVYVANGRIVPGKVYHRFTVLRETTFEDWIANTPPYIPGPKPAKHQAAGFRFYELTTD